MMTRARNPNLKEMEDWVMDKKVDCELLLKTILDKKEICQINNDGVFPYQLEFVSVKHILEIAKELGLEIKDDDATRIR